MQCIFFLKNRVVKMNGLKTKREKLLVLGDFHAGTQEKSRELENKIREIMKLEKPTHVACTGDFDHPSMEKNC